MRPPAAAQSRAVAVAPAPRGFPVVACPKSIARDIRCLLLTHISIFPRGRLAFESHDGVAQRRNHDLSDAPLFAIALVYRAVGLATLLNHPHTWHTGEPLQEVLVEIGVVPAHHDEHLGIRKRLRGQGFERLFLLTRTDSVRRRRVVIGFPLTQVAGLTFLLARRADDLHPDQAMLPWPCHP